MPIPTPEPPVKRFVVRQVAVGRMEDWIAKMMPVEEVYLSGVDEPTWCRWSEVEALLLQRAQEIQTLRQRIAELELRDLRFPAHCETPFKSPEMPAEHEMVRKYWENY